MKKFGNKVIAFALVLSVCFCSTNMTVLAQENIMEWSTEQVINVSENVELDEMFQEREEDYFDNELSIYEEENFQVVNCLTERWDGASMQAL